MVSGIHMGKMAYQWSHGTIKNMLSGLFNRQCSSKTTPDVALLNMLKRGATELCKSIPIDRMISKLDTIKNFAETIKDRGFDANKTAKY